MGVGNPLEAALANPWGAARLVLGDPLHPGGEEATEGLLDRAGVGAGTRLLDVGCGAGEALSLARARGANAVGVDHAPHGPDTVRGDMNDLPIRDGSVDVVLAECVLCLSATLDRAFDEARRVIRPDGRLALSDVVVEGDLPDLPSVLTNPLCLTRSPSRESLTAELDAAGFAVTDVREHRDDLLAMRDRAAGRVDYEGLLPLFGERGQRLLDGVYTLEACVESGQVGYVSLVARLDDRRPVTTR